MSEPRQRLRADRGPIVLAEALGAEVTRDRASATQMTRPAKRSEDRLSADPVGPAITGPLDALQAWFAAVITHPVSAAQGIEVCASLQAALGARSIVQLVRPNRRMSAVDRLEVYQQSYQARLVECLADDYPIVSHALGAERFADLACRYIEAHPSRGPNLNGFGRHFATFVAELNDLGERGFVRDLARLEWALVEVIHGAAEAPLSAATLGSVPPSRWSDVVLRPRSTLRLLELEYPANAYFQAVRDGLEPAIPAAEWSATAVYRLGFELWRMDFTPSMAAVLRALMDGESLGSALSHATDRSSALDEGDVRIWFAEWVAGGFFKELDMETEGRRREDAPAAQSRRRNRKTRRRGDDR